MYEKWIEYDKAIGYKKIALQLLWDYGLIINHKKVYRIMKELRIQAIQRKKTYQAKRSKEVKNRYVFPNVLARNFKATKRYEKICTDITEFPFKAKTVYVSCAIDLYSNELLSYQRSRGHTGKLVLDVIKGLDSTKIHKNKTIYHSDQGSEYTSYRFKQQISKLKLRGSMSRVANPIDNAPIEVFHSMIKTEIHLNDITTIEELEQRIDEWIHRYNYKRVQHKLKTPPVFYK